MTKKDRQPFDPKTHRFGMAYQCADCECGKDHFVYPYFYVERTKEAFCVVDNQRSFQLFNDLTRAPEHDLVPRQALGDYSPAMETPFDCDLEERDKGLSEAKKAALGQMIGME